MFFLLAGRYVRLSIEREVTMTMLAERITVDPEICHGKPAIRGLRYPVELILELLRSGMMHAEILEDYPDLEDQDIRAVLAFAARPGQARGSWWMRS